VVRIAASLAKVELEVVNVTDEEKKTKEFKVKMITGTMPFLETPEGTFCESAAIARYIGRIKPHTNLVGSNNFESAVVDQWIDFNQGTVGPNLATTMLATYGWMPVEKEKYDNAVKALKSACTTLNVYLQGKEWLVGKHVTVADVVLGVSIVNAFQSVLDGGFRKAMASLTSWVDRFIALPEFVSIMGKVKFCAKVFPP